VTVFGIAVFLIALRYWQYESHPADAAQYGGM
jgi:hypothetical protein